MLQQHLAHYSIILASGSPRRQQFFKDLKLDFKVQLKEVEEVYPIHLKGADISDYLAELKSQAFTDLKNHELLITSDTIVWIHDKALGKPQNEQEAKEMLQELSGTKHEVITSVCLRTTSFQKTFNDTTSVYFKNLTDEEIDYYIQNYRPYDKAGAYGIQEWIGFIGIDKIEGSYFTVMGLPVHKMYKELMLL